MFIILIIYQRFPLTIIHFYNFLLIFNTIILVLNTTEIIQSSHFSIPLIKLVINHTFLKFNLKLIEDHLFNYFILQFFTVILLSQWNFDYPTALKP